MGRGSPLRAPRRRSSWLPAPKALMHSVPNPSPGRSVEAQNPIVLASERRPSPTSIAGTGPDPAVGSSARRQMDAGVCPGAGLAGAATWQYQRLVGGRSRVRWLFRRLPSGLDVVIGGVSAGRTPLSVSLPPGPHLSRSAAEGRARDLEINMTSGATIQHNLEIAPVRRLGGFCGRWVVARPDRHPRDDGHR